MYIDINWEARTNGQFQSKLMGLINELHKLDKAALSSSKARDRQEEIIREIYRLCNFNPGFLVPFFFPQYPLHKPLSLNNRPYAFAMFHFQIGGFICFRASRQIGKALASDSPVLTPNGWVTIGELSIGDLVYDQEGNTTVVTGVFPQGKKELFNVRFTDGSCVRCCEDHLWTHKTAGARNWHVKSLREIREHKGGDNPTSDQAIRIPLTAPVQLPKRSFTIHPYVLGALLGDGSIGPNNFGFTSDDPDIVARMETLQPGLTLKSIKHQHYELQQRSEDHYHNKSPIKAELERLGLLSTSSYKFIPHEYIFSDVESRIELLRGLMDTHGSIYGKCQIEFYSTSEELARGVQFLVQSLGGTAKIKTKDAYYTSKGQRIRGKLCYRVKIRIWDINPFWLRRKAEKYYNIKYKPTRILESITPAGSEDAVCITVDSPHSTFLTQDCIVTHNSTSFAARQLIQAHILPKYRSMYVAPHQSFLDTYANRLREMERAFRFYRQNPNYRQNLKMKEYPNGSVVQLVKCLSDSQDARSKTTDELLYDEYQLLDVTLEPDIEQTQRASEKPSCIYAGTSTTIESPLEGAFQRSSQGYWMVPCPGYKDGWVNCGDPDQVIEVLGPDGPVNPVNGRPLDTTQGTFVHASQRAFDLGYIGFHIPQVIIPTFVHDPMQWRPLWEQYQKYDRNKFLQEVLGIPTEEGLREITKADLERMCCIDQTPEQLRQRAKSGYYRYVISGCDWGGSDYNPTDNTKLSNTVHVIMGIGPDLSIDILHMKRYGGMDYRSVAKEICDDHEAFGGSAIATDFGVGAAYNMLIREHPAVSVERHLILAYTGPNTQPLSSPAGGKGWFNQFSLNRTDSITTTYAAIRDGRIRCFPWEYAEEFLMECLNLYRIPSETAGGQQTFRYQKHGSKADDVLHAINFAYVVVRILLGEPIVQDLALKQRFNEMFRGGRGRGPDNLFGPRGGHISG